MNPETPSFREGHGVEHMDIFRTVTHEQFMTVRRQSPSFSFVRKPLTQAEVRRVADKPSFCLLRQLRDFILEESYAFTKIRSPVSKRTLRTEERPLRPVLSYRKPPRYAKPCVNAAES